jgi:uncharacterized repeat protein (TIGR01451 family)
MVESADITVSGMTDTADGPEVCVAGDPISCPSLRSAIRYANETSPDPDTITLSEGTYILSIDGVDESWTGDGTEINPYVAVINPDATIGDLDITDSLTINGAVDGSGYIVTTIAWDTQSITDPDVGDRIFHVQAPTGATLSVAFSNLILTNGSVGVIPNTDCDNDTNPYDIKLIPGEFCNIWQFRRYGGAIALGPGAGIAFYEESIHGPDTPGGGGKKPPDIGPGGDEGEGGTISEVTITRLAVIDNKAGADAGGIYNAAPTLIQESVISGNFSGANGGGVYNDAEMTIDKTTIGTASSSNLVENVTLLVNPNQGENGGGLFDTGFHTTTITASALNGNTAIGGAGIAGRSLIVFNITNTTISGNVASDVGGGITTNGTVNLNSSTVVDNEASTDAPGGGAGLNSFGSGTYNMHNSIVANNLKNTTVDSNCGCSGGSVTCAPGRLVSLGYNLENAETCELGFTGDMVNKDPLLLALANNGGPTETHALQHTENGDAVNSPAVEAGDNVNCPNNDQRGGIRPADGNLDTNYDCDIGAFELFIASADLHFENYIAPDQIAKGDTLSIQAIVHHNPLTATAPATLVVVDTTFPAELTNPAASYSIDGGASSTCSVAAGVVSCAIGTLNQDSTATIALTATTTTEGTYTVTSLISSDTGDPNPDNNNADATVTVIGESDLQITALADQSTVDIGNDITVTASLLNAGPDNATSVRIGTTVPEEVSITSVVTTLGACEDMDLDRNIVCNIGNLPNGASVTVTYVATVQDSGDINWSVETDAYQTDSDAANNIATATFTGIANADLVLTTVVSEGSLTEGDTLGIWYTVTNEGPQDATGVTLTVELPAGWALYNLSVTQGNCVKSGTTLTCSIGDLAVNAKAGVAMWGTVNSVVTVTFTASVVSNENDPDSGNNTKPGQADDSRQSVSIGFSEDENFFESTFGCSTGKGAGIDPTLLLLILFSVTQIARKKIKGFTAVRK